MRISSILQRRQARLAERILAPEAERGEVLSMLQRLRRHPDLIAYVAMRATNSGTVNAAIDRLSDREQEHLYMIAQKHDPEYDGSLWESTSARAAARLTSEARRGMVALSRNADPPARVAAIRGSTDIELLEHLASRGNLEMETMHTEVDAEIELRHASRDTRVERISDSVAIIVNDPAAMTFNQRAALNWVNGVAAARLMELQIGSESHQDSH